MSLRIKNVCESHEDYEAVLSFVSGVFHEAHKVRFNRRPLELFYMVEDDQIAEDGVLDGEGVEIVGAIALFDSRYEELHALKHATQDALEGASLSELSGELGALTAKLSLPHCKKQSIVTDLTARAIEDAKSKKLECVLMTVEERLANYHAQALGVDVHFLCTPDLSSRDAGFVADWKGYYDSKDRAIMYFWLETEIIG